MLEVAKRLRHSVRDIDTVARIGGDEFAVILEDIRNTMHVTPIAEKIRLELQQPIQIGNITCVVGGSIGIAMCPLHTTSKASLMKFADAAMYRSKRTKNCWTLHQDVSVKQVGA